MNGTLKPLDYFSLAFIGLLGTLSAIIAAGALILYAVTVAKGVFSFISLISSTGIGPHMPMLNLAGIGTLYMLIFAAILHGRSGETNFRKQNGH